MVPRTFRRVDSFTWGRSLITLDTVIGETPAAFATSWIVTTGLPSRRRERTVRTCYAVRRPPRRGTRLPRGAARASHADNDRITTGNRCREGVACSASACND